MNLIFYTAVTLFIRHIYAVRLHTLFQFLDGYKSEHNLKGYLHVGDDYAIFLRKPKPHDKFLTYELYEAKNIQDTGSYKPKLLAVSKVPVIYIKDQLKVFRKELYMAKYVNSNVVPGTQVRTLREWQIDRALTVGKYELPLKSNVLRARL